MFVPINSEIRTPNLTYIGYEITSYQLIKPLLTSDEFKIWNYIKWIPMQASNYLYSGPYLVQTKQIQYVFICFKPLYNNEHVHFHIHYYGLNYNIWKRQSYILHGTHINIGRTN